MTTTTTAYNVWAKKNRELINITINKFLPLSLTLAVADFSQLFLCCIYAIPVRVYLPRDTAPRVLNKRHLQADNQQEQREHKNWCCCDFMLQYSFLEKSIHVNKYIINLIKLINSR